METELTSHQLWLHTVTLLARGAEERVENAEEITCMADTRAANAVENKHEALQMPSEMEAAVRATEGKAASAKKAVAEAVECYQGSEAFFDELAEASVDVYLQGFRECKEKAVRVFGIPGLKDLELDDGEPKGSAVA